MSWEMLVETLSTLRRTTCTLESCKRSECPLKAEIAWSAAYWPDGVTRAKTTVEGVSVLVLDIDHFTHEVWEASNIHAYKRIVHASHSDREYDHCVRVVVSISRTITREEFPRFWLGAVAHLNLPADVATKDCSRLYYVPSRPADADFRFESHDGIVLDVDAILAETPAETSIQSITSVTELAKDKLPDAETMYSAAKVLSVVWPKSGRHLTHLALAGALARQGWPAEAIAQFCGAVAEFAEAGNTQIEKRLNMARTTVEKVQAGEAVKGWPKLEMGVGKDAVAEMQKILGIQSGPPERDPDFLTGLLQYTLPASSRTPSRDVVRTALESARDTCTRSSRADKKLDGLYLKRILKGDFLVEREDEDKDEALIAALRALVTHAPAGTPSLVLAEFLGQSCTWVPATQLISYLDATRAAAQAPKEKTLETMPDEFVLDDRSGQPIANNQGNQWLAMHQLGVGLRYDQFADRELIEREEQVHVIEDHHLNILRLEIERKFGFEPNKDKFYDVASDRARANSYHPVRDFLNQLEWDGVPRIEEWLIQAGAKDTKYVRAVSRLVLVAAVRRVRQPGCKFDEMLILEGDQGGWKSSALKALAIRDEWFSDDLPLDADTKVFIEKTSGKWIIEAGELKGLSPAKIAAIKGCLSRARDEARMAYGRKQRIALRQSVLIGTTNEFDGYLYDPSGNRRFWPVRVIKFDIEWLKENVRQMWAEAAHYESLGESIRMDESLWEEAAKEQSERASVDPLEVLLGPVLGENCMNGTLKQTDAWKVAGYDVGGLPGKTPTTAESGRISGVMGRLGWVRTRRRVHKERMYVFTRGTETEQDVMLKVTGSNTGWQVGVEITPGVAQGQHPGDGTGKPAN